MLIPSGSSRPEYPVLLLSSSCLGGRTRAAAAALAIQRHGESGLLSAADLLEKAALVAGRLDLTTLPALLVLSAAESLVARLLRAASAGHRPDRYGVGAPDCRRRDVVPPGVPGPRRGAVRLGLLLGLLLGLAPAPASTQTVLRFCPVRAESEALVVCSFFFRLSIVDLVVSGKRALLTPPS